MYSNLLSFHRNSEINKSTHTERGKDIKECLNVKGRENGSNGRHWTPRSAKEETNCKFEKTLQNAIFEDKVFFLLKEKKNYFECIGIGQLLFL